METLLINIPDKKSALVKQLLKELGVKMSQPSTTDVKSIANKKTIKAIEDAHNSIGLEPIKDIQGFIKSLNHSLPITFAKHPNVTALAGVWEGREITIEELRKEAWGDRI
jgi:hypothetical protein